MGYTVSTREHDGSEAVGLLPRFDHAPHDNAAGFASLRQYVLSELTSHFITRTGEHARKDVERHHAIAVGRRQDSEPSRLLGIMRVHRNILFKRQ